MSTDDGDELAAAEVVERAVVLAGKAEELGERLGAHVGRLAVLAAAAIDHVGVAHLPAIDEVGVAAVERLDRRQLEAEVRLPAARG